MTFSLKIKLAFLLIVSGVSLAIYFTPYSSSPIGVYTLTSNPSKKAIIRNVSKMNYSITLEPDTYIVDKKKLVHRLGYNKNMGPERFPIINFKFDNGKLRVLYESAPHKAVVHHYV